MVMMTMVTCGGFENMFILLTVLLWIVDELHLIPFEVHVVHDEYLTEMLRRVCKGV